METKFTRGPWQVSRNGYIRGQDGVEVALMCVFAKDHDTSLIAAAPELYEALSEIIAAHYGGGVLAKHAEKALTVLAKARGES